MDNAALIADARRVPFKKGQPVIRQGGFNASLYLVQDGVLHVRRKAKGHEALRGRREPGACLGAMSVVDAGRAAAEGSGGLGESGGEPGDAYEGMAMRKADTKCRAPKPAEALKIVRGLGLSNLKPPPPPPQEHLPRWRRVMEGLRHSMTRDAEVIHHHYDVSNRFYELVIGPSMAYTCAVYPDARAGLDEAQATKFGLVFDKLGLRPGQRLLDIGCGWGSMVRHAARRGVKSLGVTLSAEPARWAASF